MIAARAAAAALAIAVSVAPPAVAATGITGCSTVVNGAVVLLDDVDCVAEGNPGIPTATDDEKIDLNGFNLVASVGGRSVRIKGPGTLTGNISADVRTSTVTGNRVGVFVGNKGKISGSMITGNTEIGLVSEVDPEYELRVGPKVELTGNGTDPQCGLTLVCADIDAEQPPTLSSRQTTCDTSHVRDSGIPGTSWGICALD